MNFPFDSPFNPIMQWDRYSIQHQHQQQHLHQNSAIGYSQGLLYSSLDLAECNLLLNNDTNHNTYQSSSTKIDDDDDDENKSNDDGSKICNSKKRKREREMSSRWSIEEDTKLITNQSKWGNKWQKISTELPGRSKTDCHVRYVSIQRAAKKEWLEEEDALLLNLMEKYSSDFDEIKKHFTSRTVNAIRTRSRELNKIKKGDVRAHVAPPLGSSRQIFFYDRKMLLKHFPLNSRSPFSYKMPSSMGHLQLASSSSSVASISTNSSEKLDYVMVENSTPSSSVSNYEITGCINENYPDDNTCFTQPSYNHNNVQKLNKRCPSPATHQLIGHNVVDKIQSNLQWSTNNQITNTSSRAGKIERFPHGDHKDYGISYDDICAADEDELINLLLS